MKKFCIRLCFAVIIVMAISYTLSSPNKYLRERIVADDAEAIKDFIVRNPKSKLLIGMRGDRDVTILQYAVENHAKLVSEYLLSIGHDINGKDDTGRTALMRLLEFNPKCSEEFFRFVVENSDLSLVDNEGNQSIIYANAVGNQWQRKLIENQGD